MINNQGINPDNGFNPIEALRDTNPELAGPVDVVYKRLGTVDRAYENICRVVGFLPETPAPPVQETGPSIDDNVAFMREYRERQDRQDRARQAADVQAQPGNPVSPVTEEDSIVRHVAGMMDEVDQIRRQQEAA